MEGETNKLASRQLNYGCGDIIIIVARDGDKSVCSASEGK